MSFGHVFIVLLYNSSAFFRREAPFNMRRRSAASHEAQVLLLRRMASGSEE